ncbi:hypothetical protein O1M63_47865 [Streptomyces mirabilis]|nr:hypothetical protein [Streptomyces mirabilis]
MSRTGEHVAGAAANAAERWFRLVTRRPLLTLVAVVASLGALAWPAHDMRLALPDNGTAPTSSSQRIAFDRVGEARPGFNGLSRAGRHQPQLRPRHGRPAGRRHHRRCPTWPLSANPWPTRPPTPRSSR